MHLKAQPGPWLDLDLLYFVHGPILEHSVRAPWAVHRLVRDVFGVTLLLQYAHHVLHVLRHVLAADECRVGRVHDDRVLQTYGRHKPVLGVDGGTLAAHADYPAQGYVAVRVRGEDLTHGVPASQVRPAEIDRQYGDLFSQLHDAVVYRHGLQLSELLLEPLLLARRAQDAPYSDQA